MKSSEMEKDTMPAITIESLPTLIYEQLVTAEELELAKTEGRL